MRELHWHATAAEWAFVIEGRVRTTVDRSRRPRRDQRLRPRRRLVLPARPRPHAPVPGRQALPLHPDLRQRLLLRVRHVQHHRLDRPRPPSRCWRRTSACPNRPSTTSRRRRSISPAASRLRPSRRRRCRAGSCRRRRTISAAGAAAARRSIGAAASGGSTPAASRSRRPSPAWCSTSSPARCGAALAPQCRRVAIRHRGRGERHPVRLARPRTGPNAAEGRRRLHPAGLRPLDRERRRTKPRAS